jgi:hypothetical protein
VDFSSTSYVHDEAAALAVEQHTDWINLQRANPGIVLPTNVSMAPTQASVSDSTAMVSYGPNPHYPHISSVPPGTGREASAVAGPGYVSPANVVTASPLAPLVSNEPFVGYLAGYVLPN